MKRKRFDLNLYKQYDKKGREKVKKYLSKIYIVKDNPDRYGIDLLLYLNNKSHGYVEVEHRTQAAWNAIFRDGILNVPERKRKFFKNGKTLYFAVGPDEEMLIVTGTDIIKSPLQENPNKYVKHDEYFYKVSLKKCKHIIREI